MRIIASAVLITYAAKNPTAKVSALYWLRIAKKARWRSARDVIEDFPSAKNIDKERVRFELGGNKFRMVCAINYEKQFLYIKFIGTHREYDDIDAAKVKLF